MPERTTPFRNVKTGEGHSIQAEVDRFVDALDLDGLSRKLQSFASEKPVALAFAALTVGVAAGMLMRRTVEPSPSSSS